MAGKILLVEDDSVFRTVLAVALELQGFTVHQAGCVERAIELLNWDRPNVIISDLEMSGIDGRALCRYARGDLQLSSIPFIILSAFVDPQGPGSLPDLPADYCLSKQCRISDLVRLVKTLLDPPPEAPTVSLK